VTAVRVPRTRPDHFCCARRLSRDEDRISGGIGIKDLCPGVDVDLFAGGMFNETEHYGLTSASIESCWIGFGTTRRVARCRRPVADATILGEFLVSNVQSTPEAAMLPTPIRNQRRA
jgi:hypothetical protein